MGKNNGKFIVGIGAIIIAIVLFIVGCIDKIEIPGKYIIKEVSGDSYDKLLIEELEKQYDSEFKHSPAKFYMIFDSSGDVDIDIKVNSKFVKELKKVLIDDGVDEDELQDFDEKFEEQISKNLEQMGSAKWSIKKGKLYVSEDEDDESEGIEYSVGFNTLSFDVEDKEVVLKRTGLSGIFCPSIILKGISVILLIVGLLLMLSKKKKSSVGGFAQRRCPKCNAAASFDDTFCPVCGAPLGVTPKPTPVTTPAAPVQPKTPVAQAKPVDETPVSPVFQTNPVEIVAQPKPVATAPSQKFCHSCGAVVDSGSIFCQNCGAKTVTSSAPITPVAPATPVVPATPVAPAAPVYEETVYKAPSAPLNEEPASNDGHFEVAGDL